MALAGRSARRGGAGFRWLLAGLIATLLILLIDASLHSTSPNQTQQLAAGAWVDRALPLVASSTAEGQELTVIWASGLTMPSATVTSEIAQIAAGAAHNYQVAASLRPPSELAGPAGLLDACLLARSEAATALRKVFDQVIDPVSQPATAAAANSTTSTSSTTTAAPGSTPPTSAATASTPDPVLTSITSVQTAGDDLQVGDQAYQLFLNSMPKLGVTMPSSVWVTNTSDYQPSTAQVFLTSLQSAASSAPVHKLRILALSLNPAPVRSVGGTLVLPPTSEITLTFVVANVGNQAEDNLTITASISPSQPLSPSVRDFVSLSPGQAHAVVGLGPLTPPLGPTVTLTLTVTGQPGSPLQPVTQTLEFLMPAPPPSTTTTTTTTVPTTSTT